MHVLAVVVAIAALAAFNALVVPLRLERQIAAHPRTPLLLRGHQAGWFGAEGGAFAGAAAGAAAWSGGGGRGPGRGQDAELWALADGYREKGCRDMGVLQT